MRERISQISVSSRKNLSPGFHVLDTCISPREIDMRFRRSPHFHRCRMFAEYRRVRRAMICFIHFSHSKFITFRKTDSFIPRVLKLFSATVFDINDYRKTRIDSRTNFKQASTPLPLDPPRIKIKRCICGDLKSGFTTVKRTLSPALLRGRKPKVHNSTRLNERHAFRLRFLTNIMRFHMLLKFHYYK